MAAKRHPDARQKFPLHADEIAGVFATMPRVIHEDVDGMSMSEPTRMIVPDIYSGCTCNK